MLIEDNLKGEIYSHPLFLFIGQNTLLNYYKKLKYNRIIEKKEVNIMPDIAEQICLAVDQIVNKRLESIKFDTTITAVIVDNSKAKDNQYTCTNGEAEFIAYSKDQTYKINESVQVTIPNNDYSQQKIIIGRYVAKDDKPYAFTQPFDTILDVSSNLILNNDEVISKSLLANEDYDKANFNEETGAYEVFTKEIILWNKVYKEEHSSFTRLGLQGQFRSWLSSLKPITGSYGYRLEIFSNNGEIIEDNNSLMRELLVFYQDIINNNTYDENALIDLLNSIPEQYFLNIIDTFNLEQNSISKESFIQEYGYTENKAELIYSLLYANTQITELVLDSSEMYGNPYNFQAFFEQEKVYDISTLNKIFGFILYFYEKSGTFYNEKEQYISYKSLLSRYNDNLFTKDPYLCLGYDLSGFSEEQAIIYTLDSDTYITDDSIDPVLNNKAIRLRWLHEFENGDVKVINESSNISGYDIRWYRYKLGAPSADEYSGVYWNRVNQSYTVTENIPMDEINNLRTFYLLFHYISPDSKTAANEYTYLENFCPEYINYDTTGKPFGRNYSHMSYWTDSCLEKYGIPRDLASHAFAGMSTSSITKYVDQSWTDIFKQGFVFHNQNYTSLNDYYLRTRFPTASGCMHKIGFWEKFTLAYRLYWVYPEEFSLLLGNKNIWSAGGNASTKLYDQYGSWDSFRNKNPYKDFGYSYQDRTQKLLLDNYTNNFTINNQTDAFRQLFTLFTDSFGEWTYIEDEYGMKDYVPADEGVRNYLYTCLELFYAKMDDPSYEKVIRIDPFSYILEPAVNVQTEQVKVVIIYNGKVIRSNILTFTNEKEIASKATAELIAGLSLWCEDKSYGNYYIYGQNNNLFDDSKANEILTLSAKFADNSILSNTEKDIDVAEEAPDLTEAKTIIWEFPFKNTMITIHGFNYNFKVPEAAQIKDSKNRVVGTDWDKMAELYPDGSIYKLDGYFLGDSAAKIKVVGNTIYIHRSCDDSGKINNKQDYRINKTYNATSINNTVKCTISKNSLNYVATKDMSFGLMGTNGTDATLVIDFDDNKTALTAILARDENNNPILDKLDLTAHLYDFNHKEVDFNDLDLELECEWKWYAYHEFTEPKELEIYQNYLINNNIINNLNEEQNLTAAQRREYRNKAIAEQATIILQLPDENTPINKCSITHNVDLDINNNAEKNYFLIIEATVKGFGDYDLTAYKPIPIRLTHQFRNIVGTTEIIYDSSGNVDYYKEPYELWWVDNPNNVNYILDAVASQEDIVLYNNNSLNWNIYNPYLESESFIGTMSDGSYHSKTNILKPAPIYTKDTQPYGVECRLMTDDETDIQRYWIQPIMIASNQYPSSTLNKWSGDEVQLNEGSIVAPAIAAGKKNSDNTFSGVMLGDWSDTDTASEVASQTGVYGFHHGMQTYAFKEDGTAFIGKSGRGRIYFDGNTGVIKSANWNLKEDGMYLDLDDGILKMQRNSEYNTVILTEDTYAYNTYYILSTIPQKINYGDAYDKSLTYYIETLISTGYLSEEDFNTLKTNLWYKEPTTYTWCTDSSVYNKNHIYYIQDYAQVQIKEEEYNANKDLYYIRIEETAEDGSTTIKYEHPTEPYYGQTIYYKLVYVKAFPQPTETEFNSNKSKYATKNPDKYIQVKATDEYNVSYTYYEWGYEAQSYSVSGVPENWNTVNDTALKNPITGAVGNYWIMKEEYQLDNSGYSPLKVYYSKNNNVSARFITLSAAASIFPLAIGNTSDESSRNFKVDWDGTAYINNGIFKGNVTADYLYCEAGVIGGWEIDRYTLSGSGIVLDSSDGSITGGILRSPGGGILLDGFFSVADGNGNEVPGTYIGFMQSNTGNTDIDYDTQGVGMRINNGSIASQIKSTTYNAGLSYTNGTGGGYISISGTGINLGGTNLSLNATGATPNGVLTLNGTHLKCTVDIQNQEGIYARFA